MINPPPAKKKEMKDYREFEKTSNSLICYFKTPIPFMSDRDACMKIVENKITNN